MEPLFFYSSHERDMHVDEIKKDSMQNMRLNIHPKLVEHWVKRKSGRIECWTYHPSNQPGGWHGSCKGANELPDIPKAFK